MCNIQVYTKPLYPRFNSAERHRPIYRTVPRNCCWAIEKHLCWWYPVRWWWYIINYLSSKRKLLKSWRRGELNKWHSNILKIEESEDRSRKRHTAEDSSTYTKLTVGTRPHETRILGAAWNKDNDQLSISLTKRTEENDDGAMTKRKMLSTIHGIFDVLRIAAPVVIIGKILYSQVCLKDLK